MNCKYIYTVYTRILIYFTNSLKAFGSDNRAATMISTLKSLYAGQDEGAEIQRKEREREMKGSLASIEGAGGGEGGAPAASAAAPTVPPPTGPQASAPTQATPPVGGQPAPPSQTTAAAAAGGAPAKRSSPPGGAGARTSPSLQYGSHRSAMKLAMNAFKSPGGKFGEGKQQPERLTRL